MPSRTKKKLANRRLFERIGSHAPGTFIDDEGHIGECQLVDFTANGARLRVPAGSRVAAQFSLRVSSKKISRRVEVVWRNGFMVGVQFMSDENRTPHPEKKVTANKAISVDQLRKLAKGSGN